MSEFHIACAADSRYVGHSAAMLHSLVTGGGESVTIHYLHGADFPAGAAAELGAMVAGHGSELIPHEIDRHLVSQLPAVDRFGTAMWYRVLLPGLLPSVNRVLYLDVDTLVTDRLRPLWELSLDDVYLGAVTNVPAGAHWHHAADIGLDPADYFNSGVVLCNLDLMRQTNFSAQVVEFVSGHPDLLFPDQDALNLTVRGRWLRLHPRWNCMNSLVSRRPRAVEVFGEETVRQATTDPAIRHFEGPGENKPWHLLHDRAEQRRYRDHRLATPWPEYPIEGRTPANRLRRLVIDARKRIG